MKSNKGRELQPARGRLGKFIRKRRLGLRLTQLELSALSKIPQAGISLLERGESKHIRGWRRIAKLADALRCEPEELLELMPARKTTKATSGLGRFIGLRLKELGLTPEDLGKKPGLSPQLVSDWLGRRKGGVSYRYRTLLARALGIAPESLAKFSPDKSGGKTTNELGKLIRKKRKDRGWSQKTLAAKVRTKGTTVSTQVIGQVEAGIYKFQSDWLLKRLAQVLQLELAKLQKLKPTRSRKRTAKRTPTPVSEFLTARRTSLHLTQAEVAEPTGLSVSRLSIFENGGGTPLSRGALNKIARELRCRIPTEIMAKYCLETGQ